jgi:cardiolipin synthase A/B
MEATFEEDLTHATEVVLGPRYRPLHPRPTRPPERPRRRRRELSAVKTAGAMRIGNTVGAALGGYRVLGPAEATLVLAAGAVLVLLAVAALAFPRVVLAPLIVLGLWLGAALLLQAFRLRGRAPPPAPPAGADAPERPAEPAATGAEERGP